MDFVKHQDAPITSGFRLIGCSHIKYSTSRYFYVLKLSTICSWEKLERTANDLANVLKSYRIRLPPFILPRKNLYWNLKALFIDILNWSSFSFNKLEFKGHPQRIPKPISDIKTSSFGFIHDAEPSCKKWSQKIMSFWRYLSTRIKQSDWQRVFWGQNSRSRLLNSYK